MTSHLSAPRRELPTGDWNETLRSLELALRSGDADRVASIALDSALGPVPAELADRATTVLSDIGRLEDNLTSQLESIASELNRLPSRTRWSAPPTPSQLDCSA